MHPSPSKLSQSARESLVRALNNNLADGLDLRAQLKMAHWNLKGPHFAALHPLFDTFADELNDHNDEVAERLVTLGGLAAGTIQEIAKNTRLPNYPTNLTRDLDHVKAISLAAGRYLEGLHSTRSQADELTDTDTADLLTEVISTWEKYGWMLQSTLTG